MIKGKVTINYAASPAAIDSFMEDIKQTASQVDGIVPNRTQVGIAALGSDGVEVEFSCYVAVANATDEKNAKSRLMLDVLRLAARRGLAVGTAAEPVLKLAGGAAAE